MRRTKECNWGQKLVTVLSSLILVLVLGILAEPFSFVSRAESQGKVTASSAKIRQEANTSSTALGSATKDSIVSIRSQTTGSDGKIWYEVFVDANTLGYIRSDLVQITDGTTPPNGTGTAGTSTAGTSTTVNTNENIPEVTAVSPVSASVTGSQSVRVRAGASTGSQIVTMAQSGLALTVTGQANGTDGKVWYQVSFISGDTQVTGFIRSDYVALNGELTPVTETPEPPVEETPVVPETPVEPVVESKDWDTQKVEGKWYLINNLTEDPYDIDSIFSTVETNQKILEQKQKQVKSQQVWIVILVMLAVAMAGAIAFLVFKMKDMMDSAYFAEVEQETIRRRTADRPANSGKVMHTVGAEKRPTGTRPGGSRPTGASAQGGQRPTGAPTQGGQRPTGAPTQGGQRPTGAPTQGGQRPTGAPTQGGQRPTGAPTQGGQRPTGAPTQGGQRPTGAPTQGGQRPTGAHAQGGQPAAQKAQQDTETRNNSRKSKNFMTDEDEFEFEFLNWDSEDEQ